MKSFVLVLLTSRVVTGTLVVHSNVPSLEDYVMPDKVPRWAHRCFTNNWFDEYTGTICDYNVSCTDKNIIGVFECPNLQCSRHFVSETQHNATEANYVGAVYIGVANESFVGQSCELPVTFVSKPHWLLRNGTSVSMSYIRIEDVVVTITLGATIVFVFIACVVYGIRSWLYCSLRLNYPCSICLENFSMTHDITALKCKHAFHTKCINTWFKTSTRCPLCNLDAV